MHHHHVVGCGSLPSTTTHVPSVVMAVQTYTRMTHTTTHTEQHWGTATAAQPPVLVPAQSANLPTDEHIHPAAAGAGGAVHVATTLAALPASCLLLLCLLLLLQLMSPAEASTTTITTCHHHHQGLLVAVFVLMGLPLLKLAARSLNVEALSRHSARRAMPATISGASGATCMYRTHTRERQGTGRQGRSRANRQGGQRQ